MARIYLALGSNVGDSNQYIEKTIELLSESIADIVCAPIYETKAVGYTDQDNFLNTVIKGNTNLKPEALLKYIKDIENQVGRVKRFRWGPREIDIDIILYDNQIVSKPKLTIPHARFRERDFVLRPLSDLNPLLVDPVSKMTIKELEKQISKNDRSIIKKQSIKSQKNKIILEVAMKAVVVYKGKILILREAATYGDGTQKGRYHMPGGRVKPGENFTDALLREVKEETGLAVEVGKPIYVGEWRPVIRGVRHQIIGVFSLCKATKDTVKLSSEHDDYQWIKPQDRQGYDIMDPEDIVIDTYVRL